MKKPQPTSSSTNVSSSISYIWSWRVLVFLAFIVGCFSIWFFNLPYTEAHELASRLSPDHHLASFTVEIFKYLQPVGWILGGALLTTGVCMLIFPTRTRQTLARHLRWLKKQFQRLPCDAAQLWQDFRPHRAGRPYLIAVLLVMCAAILVRLLFLSYPMRYDESYTTVVYAMRPWVNLISDYSLPNNHIFHTVLVKLSMNLFGTAPWAIRFPAFLSGIFCIPAGYLLARQLYGRTSALISAGLITALPMMISYSTNARGYSQYMLISLILFNLAIYLSKHANSAGWGLFVIFAVIGFYTLPIMVFPFGSVCLWLLASAAAGETHQAYGSLRSFLRHLVSAGILTILFTLLLYLPVILIGSGLNSLVGNPFVLPLSWADFWPLLGKQLRNAWLNWNYDLPQAAQILLSLGVVLSLCFHRRISQVKVPLQITILIWNLALLVLLRRNPLDRIWLYLLPFWLIWACGGFVAPLNRLKLPWKRLQLGLVVGILVLTAHWSFQRVHTYFPGWQADPGKVELTAEYLSQNLVAGDAVAVVFPYDAQYWYYLGRLGVADEFMHQIELETHNRVFAVVNQQNGETPALVLQIHNLSPIEYQADEAQLVYHTNDQEVYLCLHR